MSASASVTASVTASLFTTRALRVMQGRNRLIDGLDWEVAPGQFWCILGRNGVGKSSLLHVLAGLAKPAAGSVLIDGVDLLQWQLPALARRRGLMQQQQWDAFSQSVRDTVLVGRTPYRIGGMGGLWDSQADQEAVADALSRVGLSDKADMDVLRLSGGERQRVALASLLAQAPALMLLDEPTSHQDVAHQLQVMRLLRGMVEQVSGKEAGREAGKAVLATCHDINLAARFATHVLLLAPDRHWIGTAQQVLTPQALEQAYGCGFTQVSGDPVLFVSA